MTLGRFPLTLSLFKLASSTIRQGIGIVGKPTDIVIEGYPRSANTFAVAAFQFAQGVPKNIAHHIHGAAQIKLGVIYQIPTIVLIRAPKAAITSLLIRQPYLSIRQAIVDYINFYEAVSPLKQQVVIAQFDQVIADFGKVIQDVNVKFGTDFKVFEHTPDRIEQVYRLVEQMDLKNRNQGTVSENAVARPSEARAQLKIQVLERITQAKYQALLQQAEAVYAQFIEP